jgi:O-antigen/teichoic acid export membrane protein
MMMIKTHLRNSFFLNTYLLIVMRVLGAGLGFLFWALAARIMTADNVGLASGAVSLTALLAGLAQLGLGYGLVKHFAQADDPNGLLNMSIVISGLAGFGLALLPFMVMPAWSPALLPLRDSLFTTLFFIVLVLSTTLSQLLHWAFLATRRVEFSLIKQTGQAFLAIILLFMLSKVMPGYLSTIAAYTIATVISLAVAFWVFLPKAQPGYSFGLGFKVSSLASFTKFSLINHITDQIQRVPDTLLPLIVIYLLGPSAGAYFFVVWTLARSIAAWAGSIAESMFAEASNTPALVSTFAWRSAKLGLLLAGAMTLAMLAGSQLLLSIYGQDYVEQGTGLLYWVALASMPGVLLSIFINFLRIRDRLRGVFTVTALSNGGSILLAYFGMVWLGMSGAGLGWLIGQMIVLIGVLSWWRWQQSYRHEAMRSVPVPTSLNLESRGP